MGAWTCAPGTPPFLQKQELQTEKDSLFFLTVHFLLQLATYSMYISVGQITTLIAAPLCFPRLHVNQGQPISSPEAGGDEPEAVW